MRPALLLALVAPLALGGCLAKTALDLATAPVKIASKGVDLATTSQSEADETRGREIRRREEQLGRLEREYDRQLRDCESGDERACEEARATYAAIQQVLPTVPADPAGDRLYAAALRNRSLIAAPIPVSGIGATATRGRSDLAASCRQV